MLGTRSVHLTARHAPPPLTNFAQVSSETIGGPISISVSYDEEDSDISIDAVCENGCVPTSYEIVQVDSEVSIDAECS